MGLEDHQCQFINPETGERCKAYALHSSTQGHCFHHDEASADLANEARSRGGKRGYSVTVPKNAVQEVQTLEDLKEYMSEILIATRAGKLAPPIAQACSSCAGQMAKILDLGELSSRLEAVERKIDGGR
ncbi:MAG: hypothetical protein GXX95_00865 [Methanomassiliicoccus sp.]|nr:hypothetical protein [Methanomassiliicoccus sp.]